MSKKSFWKNVCPQRKNFTLLEMLLTVSVIAILLALLLPSLQAVLNKGRNITCISNMKQAGLLVIQYVDSNNGQCPYDDNVKNGVPWRAYPNLLAGKESSKAIVAGLDKQQPSGQWICPSSVNEAAGTYYRTSYQPTHGDGGTSGKGFGGFYYQETGGSHNKGRAFSDLPPQSIIYLETKLRVANESAGLVTAAQGGSAYYSNNFFLFQNDASKRELYAMFQRHMLSANFLFADGHVSNIKAGSFNANSKTWTQK